MQKSLSNKLLHSIKTENYLESNRTPFGKKHKGHGTMLISKSKETDNIMTNRQTEQMKTEVFSVKPSRGDSSNSKEQKRLKY